MKKILFLILFIGIHLFVFSQEDTEKRKISSGCTVDLVATQFLNNSTNMDSYEKLNANTGADFTLDVRFPLKQRLEIKTGGGFNVRYGDAYLTNADVRVSEYFVRFPVILNYLSSNSNDKNIGFYTGIGPYFDILASQKYYFKDQSMVPENFKKSYGFGSYYKSGIIMNIGLRFHFDKNIFFDFGIKSSFDINDLFINPSDNPSYDYSSYGVYLSLGVF
ncbi:MAG: outer membrane protein beta-barrel domain [Bacteroidales bacterium]|nr:outer membrane protein beta-barrel domain [Bacteroidales bacterium]